MAALKQLLQATDRGSVYKVKVTDVAYARVVVFVRSVILISKSALMLLDAQELQALTAHEIGHEYLTVDYERAFMTPRPWSSQGTRTALRRHCDRDGPPAGNESCLASGCDRENYTLQPEALSDEN